MATCNVTLDLAYGGDQPYASGSMLVGRAIPADSPTGYVDGSLESVPLANPYTVLGEDGFAPLERLKVYLFVGPDGTRYYKLIPDAMSAFFSDLEDVVPSPPDPGFITDELVDQIISDPGSESHQTIADLIAAGAGSPGPEGPPGPAGGSDAATAGWINTGPLTGTALTARERAVIDKRQRALRHFHVAAVDAATTAVDIFVGPSDSLQDGAYATKWDRTPVNVVRDKVRRALQPPGVIGGAGYVPFGGPVYFADMGYIGASGGTISPDYAQGLGMKSAVIPAGVSAVFFFQATSVNIIYSKSPTSGSFTTALGVGGTPSAATSATAAVSHGNVKNVVTGSENLPNYFTITAVGGPVTVEGIQVFNGDETAGIRTWQGAHSGYTAYSYDVDRTWIDSLSAIPNIRLVILPIGSNDWFAGFTAAQTKTRIENIISALRTKIGHPFSIVLESYYSREMMPSAATDSWSNFRAMYRAIAAADPDIVVYDIEPIFGIKTSETDTLNGLLSADYLHPSDAGFLRLGSQTAEFILPDGSIGAAPGVSNVPDSQKPISAPIATALNEARWGRTAYIPLGTFNGPANFSAFTLGAYQNGLNGAASLAPSGMPANSQTPGTTSRWFWKVTQDATGGRTLTLDAAIKRVGTFGIDLNPNASTLIELYFDGAEWWAFNRSDPAASPAQTLALQGDQNTVATFFGITGVVSLAPYPPGVVDGFRLGLVGDVSFAASGRPPYAPGRGGTFWMMLFQDATGGRTLTLGSDVLTELGVDPVLSTDPNAVDYLEFRWTGSELLLTRFVKGVA